MTNHVQMNEKPNDNHDEGGLGSFSDVLRSKYALLGAVLAIGGALTGCSPKSKSYMSGAYTPFPEAPANARIQIGVSTESDGDVLINYIVWDSGSSSFLRKDIHYSAARWGGLAGYGDFTERGGYQQKIRDGEVLSSGVVVDQKNSKLILSDGMILDGPTGKVIDKTGTVVKELSNP